MLVPTSSKVTIFYYLRHYYEKTALCCFQCKDAFYINTVTNNDHQDEDNDNIYNDNNI